MNVTLLYFPDCPHWQLADERLAAIAASEPDVTVVRTVIDTDEAATAVGFSGSPTVHIDGVDPFDDVAAPVGLSCRLYPTPDGYAGSPTIDQLRDAISRARSA